MYRVPSLYRPSTDGLMRLLTMWLYEADRKEEGNVYYHQLICATFPFLTHVSKTMLFMYVVFTKFLVDYRITINNE